MGCLLFSTSLLIHFCPLMHKNETTGRWKIIGTVYGGGYVCGKGKVTTNGLWNSVPAQLDWVKEVMEEYSTECTDKEKKKKKGARNATKNRTRQNKQIKEKKHIEDEKNDS